MIKEITEILAERDASPSLIYSVGGVAGTYIYQ